MSALKIAVSAVAAVFFLLLLKKHSPVFAVAGETALVVLLIITLLPELKNIYTVCAGMVEASSVDTGVIKIMFKSFGILAVGTAAADICRDNSESAVGNAVEACVKILAVSCALPVFAAVLEIALELLSR